MVPPNVMRVKAKMVKSLFCLIIPANHVMVVIIYVSNNAQTVLITVNCAKMLQVDPLALSA
jgi:hypothetical protein